MFGAREGIPSAATLLEPPDGGVIVMEGSGGWQFRQFAHDTFVLTELSLPNEAESWGWNQLVLIDRAGEWWMGTRTGVLRFLGVAGIEQLARDTPAARYTKRDSLAGYVVIRLFEDSRSDIWIATVGEGKLSGLSRWELEEGADLSSLHRIETGSRHSSASMSPPWRKTAPVMSGWASARTAGLRVTGRGGSNGSMPVTAFLQAPSGI